MDLKYAKKIQLKAILLGLIVFLNCADLKAADGELSLDSELDQASPAAPNTKSTGTVPVSEQPTSEAAIDASLDAALNDPATAADTDLEAPAATGGRSEVEYEKEELQVQTLEQEYAMKGLAFGFVAYNHNYNVDAVMRVNDTDLVDISTKSPEFQSVGGALRYAILPFNRVGTDLNLSVASTVNHGNNNFSAITTFKAEVNLGYSFYVGDLIPLYFLAGVGHEITKGTDIEAIMVPGGATLQFGGGFGLGKTINLELFYQSSNHAVSSVYLANAVLAAKSGGASFAGYQNLKSHVSSNTILGKVSINF